MSVFQLTFIGSSTDLIPLLFGLFSYRKLGKEMKLFLLYFVLVLPMDIRILYLGYHQLPNLMELNIFLLIEYALLIAVLSYWQPKKRLRSVLQVSTLLFLLAWLGLKVSGWPLLDLFFYFKTIESVFIVIVAANVLYRLNFDEQIVLLSYHSFWISAGFLIYFSMSVLLFVLAAGLRIQPPYYFHTVLNIVANLFYAGGFYCLRRQ